MKKSFHIRYILDSVSNGLVSSLDVNPFKLGGFVLAQNMGPDDKYYKHPYWGMYQQNVKPYLLRKFPWAKQFVEKDLPLLEQAWQSRDNFRESTFLLGHIGGSVIDKIKTGKPLGIDYDQNVKFYLDAVERENDLLKKDPYSFLSILHKVVAKYTEKYGEYHYVGQLPRQKQRPRTRKQSLAIPLKPR